MIKFFYLLLLFPLQVLAQQTLLIKNVNIVDVAAGKILSNQMVFIQGDRITEVQPASKTLLKAERTIDARGKFLLPGLWDMHVHFRGGDTLISENKALLPLFLAYGITTVRDAGGDITPSVMQWRREIAAGTMAGPKIFTSGPKVDKLKPDWPGSLAVETLEQITKTLDSLQRLKVDYVKIYGGQTKESYLQVVGEAERRGLKITGHIPLTVTVAEASQSGLDAVEHMYNIVAATSTKEDSIATLAQNAAKENKTLPLFAALALLIDAYDGATAAKLYQLLKTNKTAVVPTLYVSKTVRELGEQDHSKDTMLAYIPQKIQATYQMRVNSARRQTPEQNQFLKRLHGRMMELVPQLHAAGVTLLAGSDCGPYNSFIYPGEALHQELNYLVAAGLTPLQALQTSIINGPKFFGVESFNGAVQAGKSSDVLMLNRNPLQDINAIGSIYGVISNKKYYSRKDLDQLLQSVKR